ncbi:hypothetical protein [Stappia sp.]|uniref:hypothetical protein n=1 Tax=Stappia sp. TaxID=1870903 RepID=UPI003C7BFB52
MKYEDAPLVLVRASKMQEGAFARNIRLKLILRMMVNSSSAVKSDMRQTHLSLTMTWGTPCASSVPQGALRRG